MVSSFERVSPYLQRGSDCSVLTYLSKKFVFRFVFTFHEVAGANFIFRHGSDGQKDLFLNSISHCLISLRFAVCDVFCCIRSYYITFYLLLFHLIPFNFIWFYLILFDFISFYFIWFYFVFFFLLSEKITSKRKNIRAKGEGK